ncbi:MAG: hypothetical protein GY898_12090 [Proteobacteria bacterium]|nr:hypothetical protein [Pseudomonadota bacterium]
MGLRAFFLLVALAVVLPSTAFAVDGFQNLKFGMSPEDVRTAYPNDVVHDPEPKGAPEGSIGGALVFDGKLFDANVEVSCFFTASGLSVIRMVYAGPKQDHVDQLLEFYKPYWNEPLRSIERVGSRKTTLWAWPWEGVQLRQVSDDGKVKYQRIDFSEVVLGRWTKTDALVCKILPGTSSCPFPDGLCAQQDSSIGDDNRTQVIEIADRPAEIVCDYQDYTLRDITLTLKGPDDRSTDWVQTILQRRLGAGVEERKGDANKAVIDTRWAAQGVELRVVRRATVKTDKGWTGPVEFVRIKRVPR